MIFGKTRQQKHDDYQQEIDRLRDEANWVRKVRVGFWPRKLEDTGQWVILDRVWRITKLDVYGRKFEKHEYYLSNERAHYWAAWYRDHRVNI